MIQSIVAEVLELPPSQVDERTGPATEGRWTSLRHLQIINRVRRELAVSLTPREIRSVRTVGDLRRLVGEKATGR